MTRFILVSFGFLGWLFWELSGGASYEPRVTAEPIFAPVSPLKDHSDMADANADLTAFTARIAARQAEVTAQNAATFRPNPTRLPEPARLVRAPSEAVQDTVETAMATGDFANADETLSQAINDVLAQADLSAADLSPDATDGQEERVQITFDTVALDGLTSAGLLTGQDVSFTSFSASDIEAETLSEAAGIDDETDGFAPITFAANALDAANGADLLNPDPRRPDFREISGSRVNMRSGPGTTFTVMTTLAVGDAVEVIGDPGDGWLKLRVVDSGQVGYIADFLVTARVE